MKLSNVIAGIDLGSSKVSIVVARPVSDAVGYSLEVLGFGTSPLPKGAIVNGSVENIVQVAEALAKALQQVSSVANYPFDTVNVSFGGMNVKVIEQKDEIIRPTSSSGEEVTENDIAQLISEVTRVRKQKDSNYDVIHVLPRYFMVDNVGHITEPVGRQGIKLGADFLVLSGNSQSLKRTKKSLEIVENSLRRANIVYSPIATGLAVLTEEEKNAGIALVDIGEQTTDVVIYQNNFIRHIASFPIAGKNITNDLKTGCGIQLSNAEDLKCTFGAALAENVPSNIEISINYLSGRPPRKVLKKNVALIIEERLKEIAAMVYGEIKHQGLEEELIGGVVLTGGTSSIPDIETVFSRVMDNMNVRVGLPEGLDHTSMADIVSSLSYASAVGLAWASIKPLDERLITRKPIKIQSVSEQKKEEETYYRNDRSTASEQNPGNTRSSSAPLIDIGGWLSSIKNTFISNRDQANDGGSYGDEDEK
ncbi:cell division protein FtsA [Ravibacter arvi]|uniref:Cell division protein FtsA n=1 Tax=Ravibacter arvi TaxID=2051041 RepID=A0ABP8LS74_9BACT